MLMTKKIIKTQSVITRISFQSNDMNLYKLNDLISALHDDDNDADDLPALSTIPESVSSYQILSL